MKLKIYLRVARDTDGSIRVAASTDPNYAELVEKPKGINIPGVTPELKKLPTIRRSVEFEVSDDELAGEIKSVGKCKP